MVSDMTKFELLTDSEEKCLQYLLDRKDNVGFDNFDEIYFEDIDETQSGFKNIHFSSLSTKGYIEATFRYDRVNYFLNASGVDYFKEKSKYLKSEKKKANRETRRYWITTGIAILALLLSVVSIFMSMGE